MTRAGILANAGQAWLLLPNLAVTSLPHEVQMSSPLRLLLRNAFFAAVFAVSIVAGRLTRLDHTDLSLVWPAAAVSAIWMLGARSAVDTAVSAFTLTACGFLTTFLVGVAGDVSVGFALVNLIIGWGTAFLLARRQGLRLEEPRDLGWLLFSVAAATGVAALLGGLLMHALLDGPLWRSTGILWTRNGVTTFAGLAVLATFPRDARRWSLPLRRRLLGDLGVLVFALTVYALVFVVNHGMQLSYFVLPVTVLVGLRCSTTVGTWFTLGSGAFAVLATVHHRGPFVDSDLVLRAALAQGLVGCALLVVLTVALFRDSRRELLDEVAAAHLDVQRAAEQLRHSALHDSLTGLANRQQLMDVLNAELDRARGSDTRVGVIFLDLNGFKAVNDSHGHGEGDLLLDAVATRLRVLVRPDDAVARLGGDEFVMVCTGLTLPGELDAIGARVATTLARPYELVSGGVHDRVSASIGTALSDSSATASQLIRDADSAMYAAKRARAAELLDAGVDD